MKTRPGRLAAMLALSLALPATGDTSPTDLAREAAGGSLTAADQLRALGPDGLAALLATAEGEPGLAASPGFAAALDRVCAQRDCAASHLYWYTDLAAAQAAAEASGRPILSLRLLGRLDEELSCANSRFFRSVLYANAEVAKTLAERFVLHWSSERPVPKVTVDFGDGRRLVGTVTGNSLHYVLDARGQLVDALPGLYGPHTFLAVLGEAEGAARRLSGLPDDRFARELARFHRARLEAQDERVRKVEGEAGGPGSAKVGARLFPRSAVPETALAASALALSKSIAEAPILRQMAASRVTYTWSLDGPAWSRLAAHYAEEARLDAASRRLLLAKGGAWTDGDPDAALARFESWIAEDTQRNELVLHRQIHGWIAGAKREVPDWAAFNERVYRELFLTPGSDPWLGLGPTEVFAVITPEGAPAARQAAMP